MSHDDGHGVGISLSICADVGKVNGLPVDIGPVLGE
jgi:hypothetical protein